MKDPTQKMQSKVARLRRDFQSRTGGAVSADVFADAAELSLKLNPNDPVFCFSADALRARVREFLDGFPGEVAYAVKANPGEHILLTASSCGLTLFDVASVLSLPARAFTITIP
jgi:hypothetical protein